MITIFKRGKVFWAYSTYNNERWRWSLQTRDRQVAEQLRQLAELELLGGGRLTSRRWSDFEKEFTAWITPQIQPRTLKNYMHSIKRLGKFLDAQSVGMVTQITPQTIAAYLDDRRRDLHPSWKRPMTDGGIKFELRILHRLFAYAVECGYLTKNPIIARNLNATAGKTMPFSQDDVARMLADKDVSKKPYLRALLLVFLHTGLRLGDVMSLRKDAIGDGALIIETRKRRRVVRLPLHPDVKTAIDRHLAAQSEPERKSPLVFPADTGHPMKSMDKHLRRVFVRCGIVGGHAHRFRDTFAVGLLAQGASLYDVAKLMGISVHTAEAHYTPYVRELQERGTRLVNLLRFTESKLSVAELVPTIPNNG